MGQGWRTDRRLPLVAVTAVGGVLAALTLAAWSPDVAAASTVVSLATAAQIQLPSGVLQVAHAGDAVPRGARLRTGTDGQATLVTLGRVTYVGAASVLKVIDGARQELTDGSAMVDTRRAPGLALRTDAAGVTITKGSVVRIERGAMLRVADFTGSSSIVPTGRRASTTIAALWQVQIASGALPGPVTALALTGDRWERALMGDLTSEDADLTNLAAGLDGPGPAGATVWSAVWAALPAGLRSGETLPLGAPRSEHTLAYVMAVAARSGSLSDRFARVRALRTSGGSWAVVARLVDAPVVAIEGVLGGLLDPTSAAGIILASHPEGGALLGFAAPVGGSSTSGPASGGGQPGGTPTADGGSATPSAAPLPGLPPVPIPMPTATPSTPAQQVVDTVVALLPTPTPSATTPATVPTAPSGTTVPGSPTVPTLPSYPTLPEAPTAVPSVPAVTLPTVPALPVPSVPTVPSVPVVSIPAAPVWPTIGKAGGLSLD